MKTKRPNILWISFEDTNPLYPCCGDNTAHTPNLDKLASESCNWTNAFAVAGVCAPARSAIITGMYPTSIGTHHMRTTHTNEHAPELPTPYSAVVPHYVRCLPEYLQQAGYYCTNNGKNDYQFEAPFTVWNEHNTHCNEWSHHGKAHWRNRPDPDQPFFAVFNFGRTHESGMWENDREITVDPDSISLPPYFPDTPKVRESMARMYSNIEYNDKLLGKLLDQLEEDGLAENTIVFHWSDHGPMPRGKRYPYDSGIHVPMIVRAPGLIEPGTKSETLVSTIDLFPTVLSTAGIPIPPHVQGQAFLGSQAREEREYVYASRDRYDESYDMVRAVRDKRFKYILNCRPDLPNHPWVRYLNRHPIVQELHRLNLAEDLTEEQQWFFRDTRPVEELYDTEIDPWEMNNLADDPTHADVKDRLNKALHAWTAEVGDLGIMDEAEMVHNWYPQGNQPITSTPLIIPFSENHCGINPVYEKLSVRGPAKIQLYCATQGASIGYSFDDGDNPKWHLYTGVIDLPAGTTTFRTKACRIGFAESKEQKIALTLQ